jgi:two-component system, OmpR family, phosphate regulon response regulator PhoB
MTDSPGNMTPILIIEDEMDMRFFLNTLFKADGLDPVMARNGKEGIEKAREMRPCLIILDVMMPKKGGALVYRQLRMEGIFKDIPVIILSAVSKPSFYHYLKMLNAEGNPKIPLPNAYIEKPPDPEYLLDTVRRLIK